MTENVTINHFKFRLYVAGYAPNSLIARSNLVSLCKEWLKDRYEIEIVDVLEDPGRAIRDNIIVTPTLIRILPNPILTIVGNLSNPQLLIAAFEIQGNIKMDDKHSKLTV